MISKRTRFEVFKRDSFTCQYCGKKAPDVVLHVDHIDPRAAGGGDDVINLVTSCVDCNLGKADKKLSDKSVVERQHAQLASLQERQEQLAMLLDWQRSLVGLEESTVSELEAFWCEQAQWAGLTDAGKHDLRKLLKKYSVSEIVAAMRIASQYFEFDEKDKITIESANRGFHKINGICSIAREEQDRPYIKDVFYIRGILKNRFSYVNLWMAKSLLEQAFAQGGDQQLLMSYAKDAANWTVWRQWMEEYLEELRSPPPHQPYNPYD